MTASRQRHRDRLEGQWTDSCREAETCLAWLPRRSGRMTPVPRRAHTILAPRFGRFRLSLASALVVCAHPWRANQRQSPPARGRSLLFSPSATTTHPSQHATPLPSLLPLDSRHLTSSTAACHCLPTLLLLLSVASARSSLLTPSLRPAAPALPNTCYIPYAWPGDHHLPASTTIDHRTLTSHSRTHFATPYDL